MYNEPTQENLIDELARLVGRPLPVVQEALGRMLDVLVIEGDSEALRQLNTFPMTAWRALAPSVPFPAQVWTAVRSAGLGAEEVFTALAVIDDHVRRYYGTDAWRRLREWGPRLASRYDLAWPQLSPALTAGSQSVGTAV